MATAQSFVKEVGALLATLKNENHPAAQRLLPMYNEKCVREIIGCWQTLQCVKQELAGIQSSMQNMTMVLMSIQQQLHHPSECFFSTPPPPPPPPSAPPAPPPPPPPPSPSGLGGPGPDHPSQAKPSSARGRKKKSAVGGEKSEEIKIDKNLLKQLLLQSSPSQQVKPPAPAQPGPPGVGYVAAPVYAEQPEIEPNQNNYGQYVSNFGGQQYSPISEPFDLIFK